MTTPAPNGIFDPNLNYVLPPNTGTWADLDTWNTFTQWTMEPVSPLRWSTEIVDLVESKTFNLRIQTQANGQVGYKIYTSDTGAFAGEETITEIEPGDSGIGAFSGRFVWIEALVYVTAGVNILEGIEFAVSEQSNSFSINNIDSSTLNGTVSAREITDASDVSVTNIQITPRAVPAYNLDLYVSNTPTSVTVIPRVISKSSPPTFALVGLDNQPRDAIVDIVVEYLPESYMSGNNLLVR